MKRWLLCVILWSASSSAFAQADLDSPEQLANLFRSLLMPNVPDPLYEKSSRWGQQRKAPLTKKLRNDGKWRKMSATMHDPAKTLKIGVRDIKVPEEGRTTFEVWVTFRANLNFEQQIWENGIRLYSGSTRGHCTVVTRMLCEVSTRFEKGTKLVPDAVFRMRVLEATLAIAGLEVDHILGFGGDGARILGDALIEFVKDIKPDLERDLLEKGTRAIVKAGDTKEIRISLEKLIKGEFPKLPKK